MIRPKNTFLELGLGIVSDAVVGDVQEASVPHVRAQAAFNDLLGPMTISVRLGSVAFLAALQDGGAQRQLLAGSIEKYQNVDLHPIQFAELTAKFFYKATLATRVPKFISFERQGKVVVTQAPLQGFSTKPHRVPCR